MPDGNRSECGCLPFSEQNEPPLQRAVLELLLDLWPERVSFYRLVEYEQFRDCDQRALLSAVKSLHIACLVMIDEKSEMGASSMSHHVHWLLTEVEAPDA